MTNQSIIYNYLSNDKFIHSFEYYFLFIVVHRFVICIPLQSEQTNELLPSTRSRSRWIISGNLSWSSIAIWNLDWLIGSRMFSETDSELEKPTIPSRSGNLRKNGL